MVAAKAAEEGEIAEAVATLPVVDETTLTVDPE